MIVYGDRAVVRPAAEVVGALRAEMVGLARLPRGIARHAGLVSLFLSAGELAQGLADRSFQALGHDDRDPTTEAAMRVVLALARSVWRSHKSAYRAEAETRAALALLARLEREAPADALTIKAPEGFRHYALYPESYAAAAAAVGPRIHPLVIGIRTIGLPLAAMVAAGFGGRSMPVTVRPVGPPFERRLTLGPRLARALTRHQGRGAAVVDEGPGLSGSSFGAVLDVLESAGWPESRIRLFPSHDGLGPRASPRNRARWRRMARHLVTFDDLFAGRGPTGLRAWTEPLTGPQRGPPEDIAAGRWRAHLFRSPASWPPVWSWRERRKYLLRGRDGTFLARFAGLGAGGRAVESRARALAEAGFAPAVTGTAHGFLVQPWLQAARPLSTCPEAVPRSRLLGILGDYLAYRAVTLAADREDGAAPPILHEMVVANAAEALGEEAARPLRRFERWLGELARESRPVQVDGRLHLWEWLVLPDGRLTKTDGIDHCEGHDLIGCQDIAWDLAGAWAELELDEEEVRGVRRRLAQSGSPVEPESFAFHQAAYLAFQLGLHRMGADAESDPADAARLGRAAERYARQLAALA